MANTAPDDGSERLIRIRLYEGFEGWVGQVNEVRQLVTAGEDYDLALAELLGTLAERPLTIPLLTSVLQRLCAGKPRVTAYPGGLILSGRTRPGFHLDTSTPVEGDGDTEQEDSTDEDESSSLRGGTLAPARVELADHTSGVVRWVEAFASGLGLDEALRAALSRAADLHDIGKADWRFQYLLYGDEPGEVLLAKSGREPSPAQREKIRRRARLPKGFRHEFMSVALLRAHASGDLVEHLVGTHHGRGRPFVPVIAEDGTEDVAIHTPEKLKCG
jgi:hypothetical protein